MDPDWRWVSYWTWGILQPAILVNWIPRNTSIQRRTNYTGGGGSGGSAVAKGKEIVTNELNKTAGSPFGGESWKIGSRFFQRDVDSSTPRRVGAHPDSGIIVSCRDKPVCWDEIGPGASSTIFGKTICAGDIPSLPRWKSMQLIVFLWWF